MQEMKLDEKEHRTHNSTYTQVGVQCFFENEVLYQSSLLSMKFSAKNPSSPSWRERLARAHNQNYYFLIKTSFLHKQKK